MFIQKLHPWHTHLPLGGNPSGHSHNNSRGSDAPCPPAAPPSPASRRPALPSAPLSVISPTCTLDADGPLDDFKPWAGFHKPPHQTEVAAGQGLARPHPDYKALHGLFGRLVKFDQLLQLVAQGHGVFGPSILRLEQLLR